jgi:hypothetical protein
MGKAMAISYYQSFCNKRPDAPAINAAINASDPFSGALAVANRTSFMELATKHKGV